MIREPCYLLRTHLDLLPGDDLKLDPGALPEHDTMDIWDTSDKWRLDTCEMTVGFEVWADSLP